jgi:4-hydroxy-3-polyprenylbenzoate decarboxylase
MPERACHVIKRAPMAYRSLREAVLDLERTGQLVRISEEIDPDLELAEIQRRAYLAGAPALLFERVKGSPFPALSNLFGTMERARFVFRDTLQRVEEVIAIKRDPARALRAPFSHLKAPFTALWSLPKKVTGGPIGHARCKVSDLPQLVSWPDDGGPFITLPQVYSETPGSRDVMRSNLGMYRVQLAGNDYARDAELGLHYQIHRGIGVHHAAAIERGEDLPVSIFVGGPPAHTFAAVMPLPEGLSELTFAGMLGGRRFRYIRRQVEGHEALLSADADFCIVGRVRPNKTKPEGPFGDHLGYYSLVHDFPVLEVDAVFHRRDAIWPLTVVGRPPQEDTVFGQLIHELTGPLVPSEIPGVHALHAVDAAGVHPLLLAIGSERYVPYQELPTPTDEAAVDEATARGRSGPQELLTTANAILGFGQASLAKFLCIVAREDAPELSIHDLPAFFEHLLQRVDWRRDLHFQTRTTIDTLDYSGEGLNAGSKLVIAAVGAPLRKLDTEFTRPQLPEGFGDARLAMPGVVVVEAPTYVDDATRISEIEELGATLAAHPKAGVALWVLVDDAKFASRNLNNFFWTTFTRANPSHDVHGVDSFTDHKHWGCRGPLIIDSRIKPQHAPPLIEDPQVTRRVDQLCASGGPLHGVLE